MRRLKKSSWGRYEEDVLHDGELQVGFGGGVELTQRLVGPGQQIDVHGPNVEGSLVARYRYAQTPLCTDIFTSYTGSSGDLQRLRHVRCF